jgi:hypothetical protein
MGEGQAMTKALFAILVAALTVGVLLIPSPEPPQADEVAAIDAPAVAVCPVEEGSGRTTTIGVASGVNGEGRFTAFGAGVSVSSSTFSTGASGSAAIPIAEIAPIGTGAGLAELPGPDVAAGSVLVGAQSVAVEACVPSPIQQTLLAGGSTVSGERFQVQLMNPYAGEAAADLIVQSESGLEAAPQLRGIMVPPRSTVVIDLAEILPGRQSLSITIEVARGNVMTVGRFDVGADGALWHSVPPALDWYLPVPAAGLGGDVVISTGVAAEVAVQVDVYGPQGVVEGFQDGVVPSRGATVVPLSELGLEGASAVRVISTQPVAAFLRSVTETGVAITSGASVPSSNWLLPAAGLAPGGTGSAVILNAGLEEDVVVVTARRDQSVAQEHAIPAGMVLEIPAVEGGANAYTLKGSGSLVPLWVTTTATGAAYSIGVPIIDE